MVLTSYVLVLTLQVAVFVGVDAIVSVGDVVGDTVGGVDIVRVGVDTAGGGVCWC